MSRRVSDRELVRTLLVIEPSGQAPRSSEGAIVRLDDGRLFLAYTRFFGGSRDHSPARIVSRVSDDDGRSWGEDALLIDQEGAQNVMSVSLLRLDSGELVLGYLVKNSSADCRFYVRRLSDGMETLSERMCATPSDGYSVVNNDRLVQLSSGRLIVPASCHPPLEGGESWGPSVATCFLSDNGGRTWRRSRSSLAGPAESSAGLQEPGVVERSDGSLWMWMRTDLGFQYESFSDDGGDTWVDARPGALASPRSPASVKRVPRSGDLLVVWNDHSGAHPYPEGKRTPLCVAISQDDGATWESSRVLEENPDGWYCYTSIAFLGDKVILSYCAGDSVVGGLNRLKVIAVHRDWLYA